MFRSRNITFYMISLGCSKNLVDSERINGDMIAAGFRAAPSPEESDIVIINTCGFIIPAKEESIEVIFEALEGVTRNGACAGDAFGRKVAAVGCLTARYGAEIIKDIPELDFVYGIPDGRFVPELCRAFSVIPAGKKTGERVPLAEGLSYAYIKIADGCSNRCSYCAIPLIRGGARSMDPALILRDARNAVKKGALELDIVAQDISSYRHGDMRLDGLVNELSRLRGVRWLRLLYCHPDHLDGKIIRLLAENKKTVRYIDIPFQHASGRILRAMGRKGDGETYLRLVERLRDAVPGIRIRSTFMVGFPGERDGDYRELRDFVVAARIDRAGAFIYSPEEGTAAAGMAGQVEEKVKRRRLRDLMKLQKRLSLKNNESMIGSVVNVLVEERLDAKTFIGRSEFDAPEVDGIFYLTAQDAPIMSIIRARVTACTEYDLMGEPL